MFVVKLSVPWSLERGRKNLCTYCNFLRPNSLDTHNYCYIALISGRTADRCGKRIRSSCTSCTQAVRSCKTGKRWWRFGRIAVCSRRTWYDLWNNWYKKKKNYYKNYKKKKNDVIGIGGVISDFKRGPKVFRKPFFFLRLIYRPN